MRFRLSMSPTSGAARRRLRAWPATVVILGLGLGLGACSKMNDVTGSIGRETALPQGDAALRQYAEQAGRRYDANPRDKANTLTYARALRALSRHSEAVAVLQGLAIHYPHDHEVLGAFGKSLADAGRLAEAADVLTRAHSPERPNWSILNAQGSVADQLGDHEKAQGYYVAALKIAPNEPSALSNLGLSYAMAKRLPEAEEHLRLAAQQRGADRRVRQNLSMVLALRGKFSEAEEIARRDLPPAEAASSVASIRAMIAQSNTWREIQKLEPPGPARKPRAPRAG